MTNAYAHLHAFLFCLSLLVYQNIHTHSYFCCLFPSVCVCVSLCVCIVSFQVALSCSMHPTVRPKRTSQSLTACALLPLSPLVLTHVFVSLLTRSLCCFSSVSEVMPFCRFSVFVGHRHIHVSSWFVNTTRPQQRKHTAIEFCSNQIEWWEKKKSCLLWSGPISVWCNLMQLLCAIKL